MTKAEEKKAAKALEEKLKKEEEAKKKEEEKKAREKEARRLRKALTVLVGQLDETGGELFNVKVEEKVYRKHEAYSQTDLKFIADPDNTPRKFLRMRRGHEEKESAAKTLGSAMHCKLLEPWAFSDRYAMPKKDEPIGPRNLKAGKAAWKKFAEENPGKILLTEDQRNTIIALSESIKNTPGIRPYLEPEPQNVETCFFRNPPDHYADAIPNGIKIRTDKFLEKRNCIVDVKTTIRPASVKGFRRTIQEYELHVQAAFYKDMVKHFTGEEPDFVFIVLEKFPPYDIALHRILPRYEDMGREIYREGLRILSRCHIEDRWPGYPDTVQEIDIPDWVERQWERDQIEAMDDDDDKEEF